MLDIIWNLPFQQRSQILVYRGRKRLVAPDTCSTTDPIEPRLVRLHLNDPEPRSVRISVNGLNLSDLELFAVRIGGLIPLDYRIVLPDGIIENASSCASS